ncbi:MAG: DUF4402 domain-containing protein [Gammaproteobacteria bacterium]|jgi:hypothetical protein
MLLNRKLLAGLTAAVVAMGGFSSQAMAGSTTGNASAVIVTPITISQTTQMNFGSIGPAAAASTVVLDTANSVTSATADVVPGTGAASGVFSVAGEAGFTYAVTLPASTSLSDGGGNTMTVDTWTTSAASGATPTLSGGGTDTVNVGATLHVGANQAAGNYSGTYTISVNYN